MAADELRALLFHLAERFDTKALSARRASQQATSGVTRHRMQGRAEMAEECATVARALGNRHRDDQ